MKSYINTIPHGYKLTTWIWQWTKPFSVATAFMTLSVWIWSWRGGLAPAQPGHILWRPASSSSASFPIVRQEPEHSEFLPDHLLWIRFTPRIIKVKTEDLMYGEFRECKSCVVRRNPLKPSRGQHEASFSPEGEQQTGKGEKKTLEMFSILTPRLQWPFR